MQVITGNVTRKEFVGAAVATAAAATLRAPVVASAEEAPAPSYDLVIVGGGFSGMCCGVKAAELGASSIIIDKRGMHGNSYISGGTLALPLSDDEAAVDEYVAEFTKKGAGRNDAGLLKVMGQRAYSCTAWLEGLGADLGDPIENKPLKVFSRTFNPGAYQGMPPMLDMLQETYLANGGTLMDGKVVGLVTDEATGAVCGVKVLTAEGVVVVEGKKVVIASGGYAANKELMERYIGENADEMMVRGNHYMTGDLLPLAQGVGAALVQMGGLASVHVAAVHPDNVAAGNPWQAVGYVLAINSEGKRFVDESLGYVRHGKAVAEQPGVWDAVIWDDGILEANEAVGLVMQQFDVLGLPVLTADSLAGLAEQIGVPADALEATIAEFNEHVGEDGVTHGLAVEKSALAAKLEGPTFYAIAPMKPGITLTFGGLSIDGAAHVLASDGDKIAGLYACGEVTGGFFVDDYVGGGSLMRGLTFGTLAAETAVAEL